MYKIVSKPRNQEGALNRATKTSIQVKDYFHAYEVFEALSKDKDRRIILYDGYGRIVDHN